MRRGRRPTPFVGPPALGPPDTPSSPPALSVQGAAHARTTLGDALLSVPDADGRAAALMGALTTEQSTELPAGMAEEDTRTPVTAQGSSPLAPPAPAHLANSASRAVRLGDVVLASVGALLLLVPLPSGGAGPTGLGLVLTLIAILAVEEAGVPLPVPGDVGVLYLGYLMGRGLASPWLVVPLLLLAVLAGASLLYGIGRYWGGGLLASLLRRVPARRLERARRLVERYGVLAVAAARAVPGMRIAVSLLAGSVEIRYPLFVGGVGLCSSLWIAVLLVVGGRLGSWAGVQGLSMAALAPGLRFFGLALIVFGCARVALRLRHRQP